MNYPEVALIRASHDCNLKTDEKHFFTVQQADYFLSDFFFFQRLFFLFIMGCLAQCNGDTGDAQRGWSRNSTMSPIGSIMYWLQRHSGLHWIIQPKENFTCSSFLQPQSKRCVLVFFHCISMKNQKTLHSPRGLTCNPLRFVFFADDVIHWQPSGRSEKRSAGAAQLSMLS